MSYDPRLSQQNRGFIALISVLLISVVLIGVSITVGSHIVSARFDALNNEYKRISLGLAEACMQIALLKIAQDYNYLPQVGGDNITVGSNVCNIKSVTYASEDISHHTMATIKTHAEYQSAVSTIVATISIQNPSSPVVLPTSENISILSWEETPQ